MKAGDTVCFARWPDWVSTLPKESQRAFKICFNHLMEVTEIGDDRLVVLDARHILDPVIGGYGNDVRVEPAFLDYVGGRKCGAIIRSRKIAEMRDYLFLASAGDSFASFRKKYDLFHQFLTSAPLTEWERQRVAATRNFELAFNALTMKAAWKVVRPLLRGLDDGPQPDLVQQSHVAQVFARRALSEKARLKEAHHRLDDVCRLLKALPSGHPLSSHGLPETLSLLRDQVGSATGRRGRSTA